uniref:Uncharacterized protein n=1 Tax=Tanacetum cinerariifolium TaxID=118510 RepID=A0A699JM70_TANCI|nr:hypothetical protein [Tanacetum cinerariifolium]
MERLIIDGKITLMDVEGKPLTRVDSSDNYDSEDEVASVDNDMANFMASKDVGYDLPTKASLFEDVNFMEVSSHEEWLELLLNLRLLTTYKNLPE